MSDDEEHILHLIRIEELKATVYVCTSCTVVSLSTTSVYFRTPLLTVIAPFDARFVSQTRKKKFRHRIRQFCQLIRV